MRIKFYKMVLFVTVLLVIGSSVQVNAQLTKIWSKTSGESNLPSWFTAENNNIRCFAYGNNRLYFVERNTAAPHAVRIVSPSDGSDIGTLNMGSGIITGGLFALNSIGVSSDGVIFAANMTTDARSTKFRVYKWETEAALQPTLVIDYTAPGAAAMRMGDYITVTGSVSDNSVIIWAGIASSNTIIKFTTTDQGATFVATSLAITSTAMGSIPKIAPVSTGNSAFYVKSGGAAIREYDALGVYQNQITTGLIGTANAGLGYYKNGNSTYVGTMLYGASNIINMANISNGTASASMYGQSMTLGAYNSGASGSDVVFIPNADNTVTAYVLSTGNGFGAYKTDFRIQDNFRYYNGSQTWYMNWTDTELRLGVSNANVAEGAVIYIDKDVPAPINSGNNATGTAVGYNYDGTSFENLPFRGDIVAYVKNDYREYRTADGSNNWSGATTAFGSYAQTSVGNMRYFTIPWAALGGKPASFAWFAYVTSGSGSVYAPVPSENPSGAIGTAARYPRYYKVTTTDNVSPTAPFSQNSYVFNSSGNIVDFGSISVHDFTMNSNGLSLTRNSGAWTITGDLRVEAGTVSFGTVNTGCTVNGNVTVGPNGVLTLSTVLGGDLALSGNYTMNGTLNNNQRAITFTGTSNSTIAGTASPVYFDFLTINKTSGDVVLNNNITLYKTAQVTSGDISLNGNILTLTGADALLSETAGNTVKGETGSIIHTRDINVPAALNPGGVGVTFTSAANFGSTAITRTHNRASGNGNNGAYRIYRIVPTTNTGLNATAVFRYDESELGGILEANLRLFKSSDATNWTLYPSTLDATANTLTATAIDGFSYWAFGDVNSPLPVQLNMFSARQNGYSVILDWRTATEVSSHAFEIEQKSVSTEWVSVSSIQAHGNSNSPKQYSYTVKALPAGSYQFRLKMIDTDGTFEYSQPISVEISVPKEFALHQNYPNPFNPTTTLNYALPFQGNVQLMVYSINGELVKTLVSEVQAAGNYSVTFDASQLASGTYIYRLTATDATGKNFTDTKKMLLMK